MHIFNSVNKKNYVILIRINNIYNSFFFSICIVFSSSFYCFSVILPLCVLDLMLFLLLLLLLSFCASTWDLIKICAIHTCNWYYCHGADTCSFVCCSCVCCGHSSCTTRFACCCTGCTTIHWRATTIGFGETTNRITWKWTWTSWRPKGFKHIRLWVQYFLPTCCLSPCEIQWIFFTRRKVREIYLYFDVLAVNKFHVHFSHGISWSSIYLLPIKFRHFRNSKYSQLSRTVHQVKKNCIGLYGFHA